MLINPMLQKKGGGGNRVTRLTCCLMESGDYCRIPIKISSAQDTIETKLIENGSGSGVSPYIWFFNASGSRMGDANINWPGGMEKKTIGELMQMAGTTSLPFCATLLVRGYIGRVVEITYTRK